MFTIVTFGGDIVKIIDCLYAPLLLAISQYTEAESSSGSVWQSHLMLSATCKNLELIVLYSQINELREQKSWKTKFIRTTVI